MSFFDDASLAFLPSGGAGKDGKAYSIKPTDGTGDFTFSRGSNLTATRVGPTGLIEKGRENLLKYSNAFSTSPWISTSLTPTSGQTGYDGSSDAWLLTKTASNGRVQQSGFGTLSGVYTISLYAKKNASQWMRILGNASTNGDVFIDLENGVFGTTSNVFSTNIESVGNGWYRCSLSSNYSGIFEIRIYPADGDFDTSGTSGSIYIQDAQFELGLAATDYIESGASTGKAGLLENEPRFDYSGGATCPSLLLEPQRVQLLPYTEYFGTGWNLVTGTSIETNADTSPEGVENATRVTSIDHNEGLEYRNIAVTENTSYTFSWYGKVTSGSQTPKYSIRDASNNAVIDSGDWPIVSNTEYKRQEVSFTTPVGCTNLWVRVSFYSGAAVDYYVYGAQLEQGSYPTSYIPNHSGGSATRTADFPTTNISTDITDSTQGSVYFEFQSIADDNDLVLSYFTLNTSTTDNIRFGLTSQGGEIYFRAKKDAVDLFSYNSTITNPTAVNKMAFRWGLNDWKLYLNGSAVYTSTSMDTFDSGDLTKLESGINGGAYRFLGNVKQLLVFPTKLSDNELQTLTT